MTPAARELATALRGLGATDRPDTGRSATTKYLTRLAFPNARIVAVQNNNVTPRLWVLQVHADPFVKAHLRVEWYPPGDEGRRSGLRQISEFRGRALAKIVVEDVAAAVLAARRFVLGSGP